MLILFGFIFHRLYNHSLPLLITSHRDHSHEGTALGYMGGELIPANISFGNISFGNCVGMLWLW